MIFRVLAALAVCVTLAPPSAFAFSVSNDEAGIKFEMPLEPTFKKTGSWYTTNYEWNAFGPNFGTGRHGGALVQVFVNKGLRANRVKPGELPVEDIIKQLSKGNTQISADFFERDGTWGVKLVLQSGKSENTIHTAWIFIPDSTHVFLMLYIGPRGSEDHPVIKAMFDSFRWTPLPAPKPAVVVDSDKGASALFPAQPGFDHKKEKRKQGGGYYDTNYWSAWHNGMNWSMECSEVAGKTKAVYDRNKVEGERDFRKPGDQFGGLLKTFYIDQKRLCTLYFFGPSGSENRPEVKDFFASFKIVPRSKTSAAKPVSAKPVVSARFEIPFEHVLLDRMIYRGKSSYAEPDEPPSKSATAISFVKTRDGNLYQEDAMRKRGGKCLNDDDSGVIYHPGGEPYAGTMKCEKTVDFRGEPWTDKFAAKYVSTMSLDGSLLTLTLDLDGSLHNPAGVHTYRLRQVFRIRLNGSECGVEGWSRDYDGREKSEFMGASRWVETAVLENAALCSLIK